MADSNPEMSKIENVDFKSGAFNEFHLKNSHSFNEDDMETFSLHSTNGKDSLPVVKTIRKAFAAEHAEPSVNHRPKKTETDESKSKSSVDNVENPCITSPRIFPSIIRLNVGGLKFMTRLSTLCKYPDSMLAAMFSGRHDIDLDDEGNYFIDSDGEYFKYILSYLRHEDLPPNSVALEVYKIALYFGIHDLVIKLQCAPAVARLLVLETHRAQYPKYYEVKNKVIQCAMANAVNNKCGDVIIHAFKTDTSQRYSQFANHSGCVLDTANVKVGPWTSLVDEDSLIRCLENDLIDDGFSVNRKSSKSRCKYYFGGMTCPYYVYKLQINFSPPIV